MRRQKLAERQAFADSLAIWDEIRPTLRKPRKTKVGGRRLRLTKAGEIRALLRIGAGGELAPRIKEAVMEKLDEVIEPTIILQFSEDHITLDQATAQALYGLAWEKFEQALIEVTAAYNQSEWNTPHERAKQLLWCSTDLADAIKVVYQLTPLEDEEIEE